MACLWDLSFSRDLVSFSISYCVSKYLREDDLFHSFSLSIMFSIPGEGLFRSAPILPFPLLRVVDILRSLYDVGRPMYLSAR